MLGLISGFDAMTTGQEAIDKWQSFPCLAPPRSSTASTPDGVMPQVGLGDMVVSS
jgi:hypothetical protein